MATGDSVKKYRNGKGDDRVQVLTNPPAVEQLLVVYDRVKLDVSDQIETPDLDALVSKLRALEAVTV